ESPRGVPSGLTYSPDGRHLAASFAQNPTTYLLDAASGAVRQTLKSPAEVRGKTFDAAGTGLLVLSNSYTSGADYGTMLREWDAPIAAAPVKAAAERTIRSRDGERTAVYNPATGVIRVRDRSGKDLHDPIRVPEAWLGRPQGFTPWTAVRVEFSPNGRYL